MKKQLLFLLVFLMLLAGCRQKLPSRESLRAIKELTEGALYFETPRQADDIPSEIIDVIGRGRALVLGEVHYVQEHHQFVGLLIRRLYREGFRVFSLEANHAHGLLMDLYIAGAVDELPAEVYHFSDIWLEELRRFNQELALLGSPRMRIESFDMNHWYTAFPVALSIYGGMIDGGEEFQADIVPAVEYPSGSERSVRARTAFWEGLKEGRYSLSAEERRILTELVSVELRSLALREEWNDQAREDLIWTLVKGQIDRLAPEEKIVVNCGMWHAQKKAYWSMGDYDWLGMRMKAYLGEFGVYNLALQPFKGQLKTAFNKKKRLALDIGRPGRFPSVTQTIGAQAAGRIAFVDLPSRSYGAPLPFDYGPTGQIAYDRADEHFDGLLVYPEATVLPCSITYE